MQIFAAIGLGDGFRYFTTAVQIAGALCLLIPQLCGLAGMAFVGMWLVAISTHLFVIGGSPLPAVMLLVLTAAIAWGRRDRVATGVRPIEQLTRGRLRCLATANATRRDSDRDRHRSGEAVPSGRHRHRSHRGLCRSRAWCRDWHRSRAQRRRDGGVP